TDVSIVDDAVHPSDPGFAVSATQQLPVHLGAGETLDLTVGLTSPGLGAKHGVVRVAGSAVTQPEAFFPVQADVHDTCELLLAPERVVFNNVVTGANARRTVLMANNGADTCSVRRIEVTTGNNVFTLFDSPQLPLQLVAGDSRSIVLK